MGAEFSHYFWIFWRSFNMLSLSSFYLFCAAKSIFSLRMLVLQFLLPLVFVGTLLGSLLGFESRARFSWDSISLAPDMLLNASSLPDISTEATLLMVTWLPFSLCWGWALLRKLDLRTALWFYTSIAEIWWLGGAPCCVRPVACVVSIESGTFKASTLWICRFVGMIGTMASLSLLKTDGEAIESFFWFSLANSGSKLLVAAVPMDYRWAIVPPIIDLMFFFLLFIAEATF